MAEPYLGTMSRGSECFFFLSKRLLMWVWLWRQGWLRNGLEMMEFTSVGLGITYVCNVNFCRRNRTSCTNISVLFMSKLSIISHHRIIWKLDMSTARRRLKSPQSLYGTSTRPTMVTHRSQSWSWMIDSQPFLSMSISASTHIPQIRPFQTMTLKL